MGWKIIYEPKAVVTHMVDTTKLTKDFFLRRSFWQGYSEIMRIASMDNLEKIDKEFLDFIEITLPSSLADSFFEFLISESFKEKLRIVQKIGRLFAISMLLKERR
ncbi:MAG: hypothetical protein J7L39_03290 [Candidatus Aenigmarchaeota archaeon]|nr:hypothetical protein [Candidatus Aenigmarchaeota archaeon]